MNNKNKRPGDIGDTSDFKGNKIKKNSNIIDCIGNIDELMAHIGLLRYILKEESDFLLKIQMQLSVIAATIAKHSSNTNHVTTFDLEKRIKFLKNNSPKIEEFYIPGEKEKPVFINITRTICRRCERSVFRIKMKDQIQTEFLNRLSSYLFALQIYYHHKK